MALVAEWKWKMKESVDLKVHPYILYNLRNREKDFFTGKCLRNLLENTKRYNIYVIEIPEKGKKGNGTE